MESENKHIIYTWEDIQKYLSGKLGPAEMHAMEKAALDDAFLAEAMEGYEGMQGKDWESRLISLKGNFAKGQTAKVISMKPAARYNMWKVAAAVLIICSGIAITYTLINKEANQNKSIAAITKKEDSVKSTVAETNLFDSGTKKIAPLTTNTKAPEQPLIVQRDQKPLADSVFIYRHGTVDKKEVKQDASGGYVEDKLKGRTDYATNNTTPSAQQNNLEQYEIKSNKVTSREVTDEEALNKRPAIANRKFTGQVVGPDGAPLPFANITITAEHVGTYADARGNFRLLSSDTLLNIEIKSVGYISRDFILKSDNPQSKMMLAEDELALKDKTVVSGKIAAYGKKRRSLLEPDSLINVAPADGWNNYDTYITNNLLLPDDILQKNIHGEVEISFDVQSDGALTNLKIDKSLCDDCDEAALRVIKEGPRWKIKKGNKASAKVKVKF